MSDTQPPTSSSRLPRPTPEDAPNAERERAMTIQLVRECERGFARSRFFARLESGSMTEPLLRYVFAQYAHYRAQLHRWFALCILRIPHSVRADQKQAIMALADHLFSDLRDGHDTMFDEMLESLGMPRKDPRPPASAATAAYCRSFFDAFGTEVGGEYMATVALAGRELVVALRNQRLMKHYFARRRLTVPVWIGLHAELEVEHFRDALRPALAACVDAEGDRAIEQACAATIARHIRYLDALLVEYETLEPATQISSAPSGCRRS